MQLGQKIKELRMMYGLTQEELADRAELSKGFISQLERDLTSPSIATLVDVLSCLGTDLAHFSAIWSRSRLSLSRTICLPKSMRMPKAPHVGWCPMPRKTGWSPSS